MNFWLNYINQEFLIVMLVTIMEHLKFYVQLMGLNSMFDWWDKKKKKKKKKGFRILSTELLTFKSSISVAPIYLH